MRDHAYQLYQNVEKKLQPAVDYSDVRLERAFKTFICECLAHMILNDIRTIFLRCRGSINPKHQQFLQRLNNILDNTLFSAAIPSRQAPSYTQRLWNFLGWGDGSSTSASNPLPTQHQDQCISFLNALEQQQQHLLLPGFLTQNYEEVSSQELLFYCRPLQRRSSEAIGIDWERCLSSDGLAEEDGIPVFPSFIQVFFVKKQTAAGQEMGHHQMMSQDLFADNCDYKGRLGYTIIADGSRVV